MASTSQDPISKFLDLLQREKWGQVADEFNKLVDRCKAAGLRPGTELELRVQGNKALKKISKLLDNEEVVKGLLSILVRSPPNALETMRGLGYLAASAPDDLGLKVASCPIATSVLRQAGESILAPLSSIPYRAAHGPEQLPFDTVINYVFLIMHLQHSGGPFLQDAFEQRVPQLLVGSLPWGQQLSALKHRSELPGLVDLASITGHTLRYFLNGESNINKVLSMVPAQTLGAWLVAFLGETKQMAALLAQQGDQETATNAQECAASLLHLLQQKALLGPLMRSSAGPTIEKTVQDLQPSFAACPEAQAQATSVLHQITQLKMESKIRKGPKPPLTDCKPMRKLLEQIERSSGHALAELVLRFRGEMEGRSMFDHVAVLEQCDAVRRLHHALRIGLESGMPLVGIQNTLNMLSLFLGIADLGARPVGFDPIGFSLLSCADRVLSQGVQASPNFLLEAFVYCFNSGDALQAKRTEVARAVIKCLDTEVPERLSGVIGWQFLAVLAGAIPQFRTSGFAIGTSSVPIYFMRYGCEFKAKHRPIRTSSEEVNGEGSKLARLALRAFRQLGLSFTALGTFPSSAGLVLERLCLDNPKLLTTFVVKETDLIIELLEKAYAKLAAASGEPPRNPTERIIAEQLADLCSSLSSLVEQCSKSAEVDQESFMQEVARSKALDLCRSVMRNARAKGTALPEFLEPPYRAPGRSSLAVQLEALVKELWDRIALAFDLKPCSNKGCANDVIELRKRTFKRCSVCGDVQYCTKSCQLVHWKKEHKESCKKTISRSTGS